MQVAHGRRLFFGQLAALGMALAKPAWALSGDQAQVSRIAASWRGPGKDDPYFAGVLRADWQSQRLEIERATQLPTRSHGLLVEADGCLVVGGVRPGAWLMRIDPAGRIAAQIDLTMEGMARLNGHTIQSRNGNWLFTTETEHRTGRGQIGVRDAKTLKKVAEWASHGLEPHQLLLDRDGHVMIANGGIPRNLNDKKLDLDQMDASLVRLDGQDGHLRQRWALDDRRLSLRHLAWSEVPKLGKAYLGVAIQAEHDQAAARAKAPLLAVLADDELIVPETNGDAQGYAGDIAPAFAGGFAVSSNVSGVARVWHPGMPEKLTPIVDMQEAYALTGWQQGGVLVAAAPGLVRWHPSEKPVFLAWPQAMALDNHWNLI